MKPLPQLQPGDTLLYNTPGDFVDWVIRVKTWSPAAHIEVYVGDGCSVASRNGIGVNRYSLRGEGLVAVLRPAVPVDVARGMAWFYAKGPNGERPPCGQGYDFKGLMCFALAAKQGSPNKMFCSEFARNWYRSTSWDPFHPDWNSDKIAPGTFLIIPSFNHVYRTFDL